MIWIKQTRGRGWFAATLREIPAWRVQSGPLIPRVSPRCLPIASLHRGEKCWGNGKKKHQGTKKRGLKGWEMENSALFLSFFLLLFFSINSRNTGILANYPKQTSAGTTVREQQQLRKCPKTCNPPELTSLPPEPARCRRCRQVPPAPAPSISHEVVFELQPRQNLESKNKKK